MSDSGFFTSPDVRTNDVAGAPDLIHESDHGWSRIYLVDKDGRFRVYKALKPEYRGDIKYETLLRKEYEIGYRMSHTGLCEVYGFADVEGLGHCIEMEWIDGVTLGSFLQRSKPSRELSRRFILQLCEALGYCHSKGIVHRDIKPENIMVTHSGNCLKIIDFGLSDSDSHSVFKSACGTASFAAPEVIGGAKGDERSDIYSLGKVISLLHPSFAGVAAVCMRSDPQRRCQDVAAVRAAVNRAREVRWALICLAVAALTMAAVLIGRRSEIVSPEEDGVGAVMDTVASSAPDTVVLSEPVPVPDQTPAAKPAAPMAPKLESDPEVSEGDETDAAVIDELFRMATRMMDQ